MTINARALALPMLLLLAAGCGPQDGGPGQDQAKSQAAPADYVAKVNDAYISRRDLEDFMRSREMQQPGAGQNPDIAVQELVNVELLKQEAVRRGIDQQPEVRTQLEQQRTNLLVNSLIRERVGEIEVTDEQLKAEYDAQVAHMGSKEYKARHILVNTEDEAKALIAQLDGGADFETLAKEHSTGPSAERGGDLGWFSPGTMVPPFSAAVEQLEKGGYTKTPVQTQFGWHVIKLEDVRENEPPPFEEVKEQLRGIVINKALQGWIGELRAAAKIEVRPAASVQAPSQN